MVFKLEIQPTFTGSTRTKFFSMVSLLQSRLQFVLLSPQLKHRVRLGIFFNVHVLVLPTLIMTLRDCLLGEKRGDHDIATYIQALRSRASELALANEVIRDEELIIVCLGGLGPEYSEFFDGIRALDVPPKIET
ncbi:unnamed protein product [Linum trigynum]|uniref:Uncharacterized protein n=1 Tax=Linum trigynum TaxID=586398 RepID=A0AAV2GW07_9ROSI